MWTSSREASDACVISREPCQGLLVTDLRIWVPGTAIWEDTLGPGSLDTNLTWSVMWGDRLWGRQGQEKLLGMRLEVYLAGAQAHRHGSSLSKSFSESSGV